MPKYIDMGEYGMVALIPEWPQITQDADGRWRREWPLVFENDISLSEIEFRDVEAGLSDEENEVRISGLSPREMVVAVVTKRWGLDDDLIFFNLRTVRRIESRFGKLRTINGEPREDWTRSLRLPSAGP